MAVTFSPDPNHLDTGAGTAVAQTNRQPQRADTVNGGWDSKATNGNTGAPGTWLPNGSAAPYSVEDAQGITATPNTPWTTGQYNLLADGTTHVHWAGSAWLAGDGTGVVEEDESGRSGPTQSKRRAS